ncbi:MAG: glycosyltransferase family 2 protein [Eubacteriales bacterium]
MKSTIVIPNFNGMKYIENCLHSIEGCKGHGNFHVIVVDNGSTDGSKEVVIEKFPHVELIPLLENTGFCKAMNIGIEQVKTPYVIFLNNDTTVDSNMVVVLEEMIESKGNIFSVSAKMLEMSRPDIIDGAGDLYCALGWAFARGKGKSSVESHCKPAKIFSACGGAAIYSMKILKQIGVLDENHFAYLEDVDLGYRSQIYGYDNYYCPEAIVYHAGSGASGSRYNEFKISLASKNSIYLIYKNMPLLQIIFNSPFLILGFIMKIAFFIKKGYGKTYCNGLIQGIKFCSTDQAKKHKIPVLKANLYHYLRLECQILRNMFLRNM